MAKKRIRLDEAIVNLGLTETIKEARASIMAGKARVNGEKIDKAGFQIDGKKTVTIVKPVKNYVSRGGGKIKGAFDDFQFNIQGRIIIDGGASTGGFTDFVLKHGAFHVYAIDVGYGQLDWSLRKNSKVTVMERVNLKNVAPSQLTNGTPDLTVMDLSFISLTKVIPALSQLMTPNAEIITLVKPQFEARSEQIGKGGIVRDKDTHVEILKTVAEKLKDTDFRPINCTFSPLKGPKGNIEFFFHLVRGMYLEEVTITDQMLEKTVENAHKLLNNHF